MPESNWRRNYTIGLIVAGLFAASTAGWIWKSAADSEAAIKQAAAHQAQQYADAANVVIEGRCLALPIQDQQSCISDERQAAREGQRNERDLEAQQTMAIWTRAMGIAAIIGMGVGIFGLGLIFTTFRETRRAANEASRSADAFITAERGWLSVDFQGKGMQSPNDPIGQYAEVQLRGRSGVEVTAFNWICLSDTRYPGDGAHFETAKLSRHIDNPDKAIRIKEITIDPGVEFVGGWVEYRTRFLGEHRTYFVAKRTVVARYGGGEGVGYRFKRQRDETWPANT